MSELGLVTTGGKVVWGKYAQVTNNPVRSRSSSAPRTMGLTCHDRRTTGASTDYSLSRCRPHARSSPLPVYCCIIVLAYRPAQSRELAARWSPEYTASRFQNLSIPKCPLMPRPRFYLHSGRQNSSVVGGCDPMRQLCAIRGRGERTVSVSAVLPPLGSEDIRPPDWGPVGCSRPAANVSRSLIVVSGVRSSCRL